MVHVEVVVVVISAECDGVKERLGLGERDQRGLAPLETTVAGQSNAETQR